jgi:hypothetical protein
VCKNDTFVGTQARSMQKRKGINYEHNKDYWEYTHGENRKARSFRKNIS